jgi:TolB protein
MLHRTKKIVVTVGSAALGCALTLASALPTSAQAPQGDGPIKFNISAGGKDLYKLAVPTPIGEPRDLAQQSADVEANDLAMSGYFKVVDPKAYLANLTAEGLTINAQDWRNVGAEGVIKGRLTPYGDEVKLEFRLYEVAKGDQPVLSKDYRGPKDNARLLVHQWAGEVVRYFTGEDSFFNSRIAFSSSAGPRRRDLWIMDWDGRGAHAITSSSQNLLPAWSPSGAELAFTSFLANKPDIYLMASSGGRPRAISTRPGLNMGAAFSPDGQRIAATLSQDGNSEIYLLDRSGAILKRLTNTPFIDASPTWSPDGSRIAFVSDRHGSPQIWVMGADGSGQTKVTRRGNYNQTPKWIPRKDSPPLVAFTARDEKLNYDIFTVNVDSGEIVRITEGHGSNQAPTWAPNGRALAYESSRGGLWISTADGRTEKQVYRGNASSPAWSPSLGGK